MKSLWLQARVLAGLVFLQTIWGMRVPQNLLYQFVTGGLALVLIGLINGTPEYVEYMVPGVVTLSAASRAMVGIGNTVSVWRSIGTWKTFRIAPIPVGLQLSGLVLSQALRILLLTAAMFLIARLAFGYQHRGSLVWTFAFVFLGVLSFGALGLVICYAIRSPQAVSGATSLATLAFTFGSETLFRYDAPWFQLLSQAVPLTPLVDLVRNNSLGRDGVSLSSLLILAAWLGVCSLLAIVLARARVEEK